MKKVLILLLTISAISSGIELGAKLGLANVKFAGENSGFILPVYIYTSVYADPDIHLSKFMSLGPSLEFGVGEYNLSGVKSGYAFLELNGKAKLHLGSYLTLFGGGGVSFNRFYLDVSEEDGSGARSIAQRIFTAVQVFGGGIIFGFTMNIEEEVRLGFEFKRKIPSLDEIEYIDSYNLIATYTF